MNTVTASKDLLKIIFPRCIIKLLMFSGGFCLVKIKEIAQRLGISISTVSKGLNGASDINEETRQLVLDTAVKMGYSSKKNSITGKRKICILIENMDYENIEQFGYEIIVGFKLSAARQNFDVSVIPTNLNMKTQENFNTY